MIVIKRQKAHKNAKLKFLTYQKLLHIYEGICHFFFCLAFKSIIVNLFGLHIKWFTFSLCDSFFLPPFYPFSLTYLLSQNKP